LRYRFARLNVISTLKKTSAGLTISLHVVKKFPEKLKCRLLISNRDSLSEVMPFPTLYSKFLRCVF